MEKGKSGVVVLVGIIAVVALILGWSAFNRSGEDVVPTVSNEATEIVEDVGDRAEEVSDDIAYAATKARIEAQLIAIQADFLAEEVTEDTEERISALRSDVAAAYEGAEQEAMDDLQEIDSELEGLEQASREETSEALLIIERLLARVRMDVSTESANE